MTRLASEPAPTTAHPAAARHAGLLARRIAFAALLATAALITTGCPPPQPPPCPTVILPIESVIEQHNANADRIPQLWSRAAITMWLADDAGRTSRYHLGSGNVLVNKRPEDPFGPQNFLLRGRELAREIFRLGSDAEQRLYYFWYNVSADNAAARWGQYPPQPQPQTHVATLAFDPNQLLSVLGVLPWPVDLNSIPFTIMTVQTQPCIYLMQFLAPRPAMPGLYVVREIWLDRRDPNLRPSRVILYDPAGRIVMDAELLRYRPVETDDDRELWPTVPTDIRIDWPQAETAMRLELSDLSTIRPVPLQVFRMDIPPDIADVQRID